MIIKESVNRAIIHRQYLHFQVENKIVAQIGKIQKKFPPCTLFSQKSPIIHVWQIPKYTIGFSCCKAYYLLSFRWSLLAVFLFLRYRNQVLFLSWSTVIFNCLFWLKYLSSFQNVWRTRGNLTSAFGSTNYCFDCLSKSYFKIYICS